MSLGILAFLISLGRSSFLSLAGCGIGQLAPFLLHALHVGMPSIGNMGRPARRGLRELASDNRHIVREAINRSLRLNTLHTQPLAVLLLRLPFEPQAFYPVFLVDPLGAAPLDLPLRIMAVLGKFEIMSYHVPLIAFTLGALTIAFTLAALTFVGLLGGAALLLLPLRLLVVGALLDDPPLVIRL